MIRDVLNKRREIQDFQGGTGGEGLSETFQKSQAKCIWITQFEQICLKLKAQKQQKTT